MCVYCKEESWERWGDRAETQTDKRKVGVRVSINQKFTSFMYSIHVHVHAYTCRLFVKLSSTYLRSPRSAQSTGRLLTLQRSQSGSTSPLLTSSIHHNLQPRHNPAQLPLMCNVPSTWPSRYSTRMTPSSRVRCTSLPQESVPSMECAVRLYHVRLIT